MTEALPRLLALQACDQRLWQTVLVLETLQQRLTVLQKEAESEASGLEALRDAIAEAERTRWSLAEQIDQVKEQLRNKKSALPRRRPGPARDAAQREVALLEARKAALEEKFTSVETQHSQNIETLRHTEELVPAQAEERQRTASMLLGQIAATEETLRVMQNERARLAMGVPPLLLYKYERIFSRRGGVAVAAVEHETCQGCHLHVPPHICLELQRHPEMILCPNCQRILFVPRETAVAPASPDLPPSNRHQPGRRPRRTEAMAHASKTLQTVKISRTIAARM